MSATILGCREKQFEFVLSENKMSNNIYFKNKKFIENFYKLLEKKKFHRVTQKNEVCVYQIQFI